MSRWRFAFVFATSAALSCGGSGESDSDQEEGSDLKSLFYLSSNDVESDGASESEAGSQENSDDSPLFVSADVEHRAGYIERCIVMLGHIDECESSDEASTDVTAVEPSHRDSCTVNADVYSIDALLLELASELTECVTGLVCEQVQHWVEQDVGSDGDEPCADETQAIELHVDSFTES